MSRGFPSPGALLAPPQPSPGPPRCGHTEESRDPPAIFLELLGLVSAVEELALEQLHGHHSEDEHEEHVDDEDVEDILERVHHTVEHGLGGGGRRGERA